MLGVQSPQERPAGLAWSTATGRRMGEFSAQELATVEAPIAESSYEFRRHDIIAIMVANEIEFLRRRSHMSTIFQISQHTISYVMVLLWIGPVLDTLRQIL